MSLGKRYENFDRSNKKYQLTLNIVTFLSSIIVSGIILFCVDYFFVQPHIRKDNTDRIIVSVENNVMIMCSSYAEYKKIPNNSSIPKLDQFCSNNLK